MSRRKRYTRNLGRRRVAPIDCDRTTEWVRFEHALDGYGLFTYVPTDEEDDWQDLLDETGRAHLAELRAWFNEHLGAPALGAHARERFWFRSESADAVDR